MQLFRHPLLRGRSSLHNLRQHPRSFKDFAAVKQVRDRGLDHAVDREKHLKPVLNLKNLIKWEPSKSLPLSVISQNKDSLEIPTRPVEFIRRYPSIFEEFFPGGVGIHPHIKLTSQVLDLDSEEELVYQSENYRQDVTDRVLKLLMVSRIHKIPLKVLDLIMWDLGLPRNFVESVVPEFPDCFRVVSNKGLSFGLGSDLELELVCWSDELSVSYMEKKAKCGHISYQRGMPIAFPVQFSRGFDMDKKVKKWFDEWQMLPYISPYENASYLGSSSDESDKWVVGVLHEILSLFVSKKVEKEILLCLGEWLGIRSRFKRALLQHPEIFYLSSKMATCTVVLKEAHKRGLLIEKNPVLNIRNQYIHLMNMVLENKKSISVPDVSNQKDMKAAQDSKGREEKEDYKDGVDLNDTGSDFEDDSDDYENDKEEESESRTQANRKAQIGRELSAEKNLNSRAPSRIAGRERSEKRYIKKHAVQAGDSRRTEMMHEGHNFHRSSKEKLIPPKIKGKLLTEKRTPKINRKFWGEKRTAT